MIYAFIRDVPVTEGQYSEIRAEIETAMGGDTPQGLVAHLVLRRDGGLRYVDVWRSEAEWEAFRDEFASPAVRKMMATNGITPPATAIPIEPIDVVHAWVGSSI